MNKVNVLLTFTGIVFYNIINTHAYKIRRYKTQYKTEYEALIELVQFNYELFEGISLKLEGASKLKNRSKLFLESVEKLDPINDKQVIREIAKFKDIVAVHSPKLDKYDEIAIKLKGIEGTVRDDKSFIEKLQSRIEKKEIDLSKDYRKSEAEIYRKLIDGLNVTRDLAEIEHDKMFLYYHDVAKSLEIGINKLEFQFDAINPANTNADLTSSYNELVSKFKADSLYISTWIKIVEFYQSMLRKIVEKTGFVNDNLTNLPGAEDLSDDFKHAKEYILHANTNLNSGLAKVAGGLASAKYSNDFFSDIEPIATNVDVPKYTKLREAYTKYTEAFQEAMATLDFLELHKYTRIALNNVIKLLGLRYVIYSNINEEIEKDPEPILPPPKEVEEKVEEKAEEKAEEKPVRGRKGKAKAKAKGDAASGKSGSYYFAVVGGPITIAIMVLSFASYGFSKWKRKRAQIAN